MSFRAKWKKFFATWWPTEAQETLAWQEKIIEQDRVNIEFLTKRVKMLEITRDDLIRQLAEAKNQHLMAAKAYVHELRLDPPSMPPPRLRSFICGTCGVDVITSNGGVPAVCAGCDSVNFTEVQEQKVA